MKFEEAGDGWGCFNDLDNRCGDADLTHREIIRGFKFEYQVDFLTRFEGTKFAMYL